MEEAKGTIIEDEVQKLTSEDGKHYLQSDLLRLLALHKYGGVWVDMDIIFLRDFKPILIKNTCINGVQEQTLQIKERVLLFLH